MQLTQLAAHTWQSDKGKWQMIFGRYNKGPVFNCLLQCKWMWMGKFCCNSETETYTSYSFDMIYLLTAIGLPPSGSSTVHIYIQTVHRTTQLTQTVHRTTQFIHTTTQFSFVLLNLFSFLSMCLTAFSALLQDLCHRHWICYHITIAFWML